MTKRLHFFYPRNMNKRHYLITAINYMQCKHREYLITVV